MRKRRSCHQPPQPSSRCAGPSTAGARRQQPSRRAAPNGESRPGTVGSQSCVFEPGFVIATATNARMEAHPHELVPVVEAPVLERPLGRLGRRAGEVVHAVADAPLAAEARLVAAGRGARVQGGARIWLVTGRRVQHLVGAGDVLGSLGAGGVAVGGTSTRVRVSTHGNMSEKAYLLRSCPPPNEARHTHHTPTRAPPPPPTHTACVTLGPTCR